MLPSKTTTGKQNLLQELVLINLVHNSHVLFQIGISLISLATVFTLKHFLFSVCPCNVPAKTLRVKVLLAKLTLGFPCKQKPQSPRSWSQTRSFCNFGEQMESVGIFVTTRTQRAQIPFPSLSGYFTIRGVYLINPHFVDNTFTGEGQKLARAAK